jgi:tetrahydromethanopterin S-methyltransferase subunit F
MLILAKFIFGVGGLPSGFETTREAGIFLGLIFSAGIVGGSATLLVQDLTIPRD